MGAKVLQRLDILLFANTAQYRSEMRDTQQSTQTMMGAIKADAANMAKVGAAAFAGVAAAGSAAVGVMIKEQAELATEIVKLAKVSNTNIDVMQKHIVAARAMGVEQETLGDIYKDTQDKIGDFLTTGGGAMADFFDSMPASVNMTAESFRKLSGPEALQRYYNGLQEANLSNAELVFHMEGMASDASLLIPLLHDNGAGFDVWAEAAENAGVIMDEKTIASTQTLIAANDLLSLSVEGAKTQFTSAFIPVLADVADELVGTAGAADLAREMGEGLVIGFKGVSKVGIGVAAVFDAVGSSIGGAAAIIGTLMSGVDIWDGGIEIAVKIARNFRAAGEINRMVDQDIRDSLSSYGDTLEFIDNVGNGTRESRFLTAAKQQEELRKQLGLTGQQIQANAAAADVAAKASEKASKATIKSLEKQADVQARLVGIAGNSGIGTGSHVDIRYASDDARRHTKPSQDHVNRFEVNGKALGSLRKTSDFNLKRVHPVRGSVEPHYGIDYDTAIGDNITTKVPVKDVKAWHDTKGGGYVTTVTFADGVKMNLLHQTPASKNIKGGSSGGTSNSYSQASSEADQLFKQQEAAAERHQAELARIAEQQAKDRTAIRYEYANKVVQIEMQLADKIEKINASGFNDDERLAFVEDAKQRAAIELANYEDTQAKKIAAFGDFAISEREIIAQNAMYRATEVIRDTELTEDARTQALEFIKQKAQYELNQLDLTHDREMQYAQQAEQTDVERIRNQYALERREIQLTINMDEELRKAKLDALNQAEKLALDERRYAYESELRQLTSIGQSDLRSLRQYYAEERRMLDSRTDIDNGQKSDLRNAMAGAETYNTTELQKNVRDPFNAQQADMRGMGASYGLAQQYQGRLDVIQDALDAEVIAVEQAEQAKYAARYEFENAATQLTLSQAEATAGGMAASFKTMMGEQNLAYQLMFAGQQSFVMASAGLNMWDAYGDAMAEGATMSQKFAAAATIAAEFGRVITAASSMTLELPGYRDGGYTGDAPEDQIVGYVHGREHVSDAATTRQYRPELEAMSNGTYERQSNNKPAPNVSVSVSVTMDGKSSVQSDSQYGKQIGQGLAAVVVSEVNKMTRPNGTLDRLYVKR